ncbi:MAG TPA: hypothetical protein ENJ44_04765 [Oceanospirillales bacterium]|nr:hypothetical protein [Oceanospirillales bacterium]
MYELIIILTVLTASIGILLYFVGWINTIFMALGNNQKLYAFIIFLLNPLAIYYCLKNWQQAKTQGKQLIIGLFIMCISIIPAVYYYYNFVKT